MIPDLYCYPGTNVLRNLFEIREEALLKQTEARVAAIALLVLEDEPLRGLCDEPRLRATHKAIFGDIYPWAGKYRENTGTMTKGRSLGYNVTYGASWNVVPELTRIFGELAALDYLRGFPQGPMVERLAYFYSELDSTHPFREGNSRTLRQFSADLALAAGYELDWTSTGDTEETRSALYYARDQAFQLRRYSPLEQIIARNLHPLQP